MAPIKKIDEFTDKGSGQQRFQWRRIAAGLCDRCGKIHDSTRTSWLTGKPVKVKRRTCNACTEKAVMAKLYPEQKDVV